MKQILLILMAVVMVGCAITVEFPGKASTKDEESEKIIEAAIRGGATGELTKEDYDKVTAMNLKNKQLTSVKGLEKCTQLTYLLLGSNQLTDTDVKGLMNLTNLDRLDLDSNQITHLKGLEKLTKLEVLWIRNNPDITKAQIAELQKALPKCLIEHTATK
jgi:Leucine-rich repeat (LRR) protein